MGAMRRFRHKITGLEADYPEHFGDLKWLGLEPVEPGDEAPCYDCVVQDDYQTDSYDDAVEEDEEYGD